MKNNNLAEQKLSDAIEKIDLLKKNLGEFDLASQINLIATIRRNVISDTDIRDDFQKIHSPSELHRKFVGSIFSLITYVIKCEDVEEEKHRIMSVFSISDCNDGQFSYYDIPLLSYWSFLCKDEETKKNIENQILAVYKDVYYDRTEALLTYDYFLSFYPEFKTEIVKKYMIGLESAFDLDRFLAQLAPIADIKENIKENALSALKDIYETTAPICSEKTCSFVHSQIERISKEIDYVFDFCSNIPTCVISFIQSMNNYGFGYRGIDIFYMANEYADYVVEECNMFSHVDDDENSGIFKTTLKVYTSVCVTAFGNFSPEMRALIKKRVFEYVDGLVNYCFDRSIDKDLSLEHYKRPKPKENSNRTSSDGCYITTAVCDFLGKEDDCYELQTLRWFRDHWVEKMGKGHEYIRLYYDTAPQIVTCIQHDSNKDIILSKLASKIQDAVNFINRERYQEAFDVYYIMMKKLINIYLKRNV